MTDIATIKRCRECRGANEPGAAVCAGCGHDEFLAPETTDTYLACDHCGEVAIESATGVFHDGDGDECMTCGFPGGVCAHDGGASWDCSFDPAARCDRPDCPDCGEEQGDERD